MISFILLLFSTLTMVAPEHQKESIMEEFLPTWDRACNYTLEVIKSMPEEHFDFKPTEDVMSFKEQIVHITGNLYSLSGRYITEEKVPKQNKLVDSYTKKDLIIEIEEAFNLVRSNAQKMNDANSLKKIKFFSGEMLSKKDVFGVMRDHMTHHRSQMITYLRINNIKPPQYVGW